MGFPFTSCGCFYQLYQVRIYAGDGVGYLTLSPPQLCVPRSGQVRNRYLRPGTGKPRSRSGPDRSGPETPVPVGSGKKPRSRSGKNPGPVRQKPRSGPATTPVRKNSRSGPEKPRVGSGENPGPDWLCKNPGLGKTSFYILFYLGMLTVSTLPQQINCFTLLAYTTALKNLNRCVAY